MTIKLVNTQLKYVVIFEDITGAKVKDCIETPEKLIFIVEEHYLQFALQPKKLDVVKNMLKKNIEIIHYSKDVCKFVANIFHNCNVKDVKMDNNNTIYVYVDKIDKPKAIGKNSKNLYFARELVAKYHKASKIVIM